MYAKITNGVVEQFPVDLRAEFPNTSFPDNIPTEDIPEGYVAVVNTPAPTVSPTQKYENGSLAFDNGVWSTTWIVQERSADELAALRKTARSGIEMIIQNRLNGFAKERGYTSIAEATTYTASTVEKYRTEAMRCVQLRDQTWEALYAYFAQMDATGSVAPFTVAEVEGTLPSLTW